MIDVMQKHLVSEEQEIIDCILAGPLNEGLRDWRTGRSRLHGLVRCKAKRDKTKNLQCKIKVYNKYISILSRELTRRLTDRRKQEVQGKILAAKSRIERWNKVIASRKVLTSKELTINKDKRQKKLLKKKLKQATKASKKGNLWGFRV